MVMELFINFWYENRAVWKHNAFLRLSHGRSFTDMCQLDDCSIFEFLNKIVMSNMVPARSRWSLFLDLGMEDQDTLSRHDIDVLRNEVLDENPNIDPFSLELDQNLFSIPMK